MDVPYIALHYLEHDSLSFAGDVHGKGRLDLRLLLGALFRPAVTADAAGWQVTLRWLARAGRSYRVFTAPDLGGPWAAGQVFNGDDTEVSFTEPKPAGVEKRFYKLVVW